MSLEKVSAHDHASLVLDHFRRHRGKETGQCFLGRFQPYVLSFPGALDHRPCVSGGFVESHLCHRALAPLTITFLLGSRPGPISQLVRCA